MLNNIKLTSEGSETFSGSSKRIAEEENCSLIVMSPRGHTILAHLLAVSDIVCIMPSALSTRSKR